MLIEYVSTDLAVVLAHKSALTIDPSTAGTTPTPEKPIQPTGDAEPPQGNLGIGILI